MAPLMQGDFIEYSGVKMPNGEILVYDLVVTNVQLTTDPTDTNGAVYIRMEDALIGVYTNNPDAEGGQTRVSFLIEQA
jgi:hypothetical protein